jgi:hypothetical protein
MMMQVAVVSYFLAHLLPACYTVYPCRLFHASAARANMMMRFSKVTPEGAYVPPPPANSKASYATMLFVRADIVRNSGGVLSKAVTIATRYAAVRRQTAPGPGAVPVSPVSLLC